MAKVVNDFATGSKGLIKGAIGALNGWLVKIKQPTKVRDNVSKFRQIYIAVNNVNSIKRTKTLVCLYSFLHYYY